MPTKQTSIRLEKDLIDRLDAYAAWMKKAMAPLPFRMTRAAAIRSLLTSGLLVAELSMKRTGGTKRRPKPMPKLGQGDAPKNQRRRGEGDVPKNQRKRLAR